MANKSGQKIFETKYVMASGPPEEEQGEGEAGRNTMGQEGLKTENQIY